MIDLLFKSKLPLVELIAEMDREAEDNKEISFSKIAAPIQGYSEHYLGLASINELGGFRMFHTRAASEENIEKYFELLNKTFVGSNPEKWVITKPDGLPLNKEYVKERYVEKDEELERKVIKKIRIAKLDEKGGRVLKPVEIKGGPKFPIGVDILKLRPKNHPELIEQKNRPRGKPITPPGRGPIAQPKNGGVIAPKNPTKDIPVKPAITLVEWDHWEEEKEDMVAKFKPKQTDMDEKSLWLRREFKDEEGSDIVETASDFIGFAGNSPRMFDEIEVE